MQESLHNIQKNKGDRKIRRRFRGIMESKTGKAVGYTSLVAPVIGFIINDLRKPNSIVRQLIGKIAKKLLESRYRKVEVIDITDKVEISNDTNNKKLIDS